MSSIPCSRLTCQDRIAGNTATRRVTCPKGRRSPASRRARPGFLTIGGVYAATIDADVARQSGGVYLVRLEDTDQARVAEGAAEQFAEAFAYFSIGPDEDDQTGRYGPYSQSARARPT